MNLAGRAAAAGVSVYEPQPGYQSGLPYSSRSTPDVSFNADPNTGVAVYDSVPYSGQSGWFQVGGTSAATPAWAGLVAIADQGLATGGQGSLSGTQAQTDLYALPSSDFNDITTGFNGYYATPGYDLVTGLGSPKANLVIADILAANGVSEGSTTTQVTVSTPAHQVGGAASKAFRDQQRIIEYRRTREHWACGQYHVLEHVRNASTGDAGQLDPGATGRTASHRHHAAQPEHCSAAFAGAESGPTTSELVAKPGN